MVQPEHDPQGYAEFSVEVFVDDAVTIRAAAWPSACFNRRPVKIKMECPGWGVYKPSADLAPIPYNARARISQNPGASKSSASAQARSAPSKQRHDQRDGTTEAFETCPTGKTQFSEGSAWCCNGRAAHQRSQTPSTIPDSFCSRVPRKRKRSGRQSAEQLTSECRPARKFPRISPSEDGKSADQHTSECRSARKSPSVSQRQKTARAMHEKSP